MEEDNEGTKDMPIEYDDDAAICAALSASIDSTSKAAEISPEDTAWVDSCLAADPQLPNDDWASLREALFQALTTQFTAPHDDDDEPYRAHVNEIAEDRKESNESVAPEGQSKDNKTHNAHLSEITEEHEGDESVRIEGQSEGGDVDNYQADIEAHDSIFKVWELEKAEDNEEESELVQQLKKVLMGSKLENPSKSQEELPMDELVAALKDLYLSLEPPSE